MIYLELLGCEHEKVEREPRRVGIGAHLEKNRRTRGLARGNPQQNAQAHQGSRPGRRRGDDHPGEAEIRTVMVEPLQKTGLATSIGDTIKSLILEFDGEDRLIATEIWVPPRVSRRVFSNWRHARRAQNPYGRNESWRARCSRRVSPDL